MQGKRAKDIVRGIAFDPDFQQLQDKCPKEFAEAKLLLQNASGLEVLDMLQRRDLDVKIKAILEVSSTSTDVK